MSMFENHSLPVTPGRENESIPEVKPSNAVSCGDPV